MDYLVVLGDLFLADLQDIISYLESRADPETAARIGYRLLDLTVQAVASLLPQAQSLNGQVFEKSTSIPTSSIMTSIALK